MEEIKNNDIPNGEVIEDKNLSEEILSNIKDNKIAPRPRWQFLFRNYFLWTIGFLALFFGAVSISLIIFMLRYNEWSSYSRLGGGPLEFLLLVVPLFWIISLVIFVVLVYFNFKKTKHGYRFQPFLIVAGAILISVIMGCAFFLFGIGQRIDAVLGRNAPLYDSVINPRMRFWSNPEAGRLSGLLVYQESEGNFILVDNNNIEWRVNYIEGDDEKLVEAKKNGMVDDETLIIAAGQPVRFLGEVTAEKEFKAKEMIPFHPGRQFFYRFESGHPGPGKNMMPGIINPDKLTPDDPIAPRKIFIPDKSKFIMEQK
jgi:heme/copper-type cytochrome/quinol oxidase subunit 2